MSASNTATGCPVKPVIATKPKAVSVNGVVISRAAISRETQNHPASKPVEAWLAAARALVVRELLLQEARLLAITPVPAQDGEGRRETDEEAMMRALVAQEVRTPEADDATCRRYFDTNRSRFRSTDLYEVRHILLPVASVDPSARAAAVRRADAIIAELQRDPSAFGAIAAEVSACPSGKAGGSLGQIGPGQTIPEFEAALASMPEGEIAPTPVVSRYGVHVVWLDRHIQGRELLFEMVRDRIASWLDEKVRRTAIRQYIGILAGRAEISGIDLSANASPLVQ